jgi:23S rRNA (cytosine1962-C5)-methyltransferase
LEISNRLQKNLKRCQPWAQKHGIEAYRIYDRDIPEYPFIVDIYGEHVILSDRREEIDFSEDKLGHIDDIKNAIRTLINPKEIIEKRRSPQRQKSEKSQQYQKLGEKKELIVIREAPAKFWVNLHDYLDTGLFLDHRLVRQQVMKFCKPGSRFLNLFSYTASVSVFAALGGARTVSVDLSNTYSDWAKDNFELNKLRVSDHEFVISDVLDWMREKQKEIEYHKMFDLILIDPPTFSNSKSMDGTFEVERDHYALIRQAFEFLKPGGTLIFSNNKRGFKMDPRISALAEVREISEATLPFDFRDKKIRKVFEMQAKD